MTQFNLSIDSGNFEVVKAHIRTQFAQFSWWPTEAPWRAQADFAELQGTPESLSIWCERWLNGAQRAQLQRVIRKAGRSVA
jgi:hypothetical protein